MITNMTKSQNVGYQNNIVAHWKTCLIRAQASSMRNGKLIEALSIAVVACDAHAVFGFVKAQLS